MSAIGAVKVAARRSAKAIVEGSLVLSGLPTLARARRRSDVLVLAYHNVVPDGQSAVGDLSLHIPQRLFARQLDAIDRTHDVVPLEALLEPSRSERPRAIITFDDAYAGAVQVGVNELVRRGLPATIFVAPDFVNGGTFWWDEIAHRSLGFIDPEVRRYCLDVLRGYTPDILSWAGEQGIPRNAIPSHQRGATVDQLARATSFPGISLAAHTWSHPNLTTLTAAELEDELVRPLHWLGERFDRVLPWLTYPYGLRSREVEYAAKDAGYCGAFRVDGGWLGVGASERYSLPRLNIPAGLSLGGFELRAAGLVASS